MNKRLLKKYAELVVKVGVNVQKGQGVVLRCSIDQGKFAALLTEAAYKAGAKWVEIQWQYQETDKLDQNYQTLEQLSQVTPWELAKEEYMLAELPALIYVLSDDPDGLNGVDQEKLQRSFAARKQAVKKYRDARENKYQWTIVAAPSTQWAKKVFPEDRAPVAVKKLGDAILSTVHLTPQNDPIQAWAEHNANFQAKTSWLTDYNFDYLHYTSDRGTDFKAWLIDGGQWLGGSEATLDGVVFNPNMPTEEVFTTPLKGKAEGILYATKPLSYQGQLIEDFSLTFKDGKAVDCTAAKGEKLLREMLATDEGAAYIGELALVPVTSPIAQSGLLFYETLFDENASCHVALGRGFSMALPDYQSMSWPEVVAGGINDSLIHVDFMIGDPTLNVTGHTRDGKSVPIFTQGNWAF